MIKKYFRLHHPSDKINFVFLSNNNKINFVFLSNNGGPL